MTGNPETRSWLEVRDWKFVIGGRRIPVDPSKTVPAKRWWITRLDAQRERKLYFLLTLLMLGIWGLTRIL